MRMAPQGYADLRIAGAPQRCGYPHSLVERGEKDKEGNVLCGQVHEVLLSRTGDGWIGWGLRQIEIRMEKLM
jgi:hypothetical protein